MPRLKYLLDTHAFLWAAVEDQRLSARAARVIATTPWDRLAIGDVTLQEIGLLLHLGRLRLSASPTAVLRPLLDFVTVLPITLEIALAAPALPLPHGDQFDRIIAATAKLHKLVLVSKDSNIAGAGIVETLW